MVGPRSPSSNLAVESNATRHFLSRTTIPVRGTARGRDSRARFARNRESWVFVFSPAGFIVAALFENVARMLLSIEIGQNCSILRTCTWRGRRPILLSSIYFPDRKLIGNTCIAVVHGQTTGAETGRSSGGIRVYVCVYAVNAMNHLDSFKSDVVNPTLSPSPSLSRSHPRSILFSLFFRFVVGTRMVGRVERSWHVRSPSFSSDSRNIRGSNRAAGRKERGKEVAAAGRIVTSRFESKRGCTRCCNVSPW